ncbi:hypothetical protein Bbelb_080180 [Branchiostoma belcheri]|nr:hypothetical protein Bbelb_080180 [Branchiostoma belcheri]
MQDEINILQTNINTNCNSRDGNDCDDLIAEVQRLRDENSSLLKIIEELTTQQNASNSKQLNTTNPPAQQNQHHLQHTILSAPPLRRRQNDHSFAAYGSVYMVVRSYRAKVSVKPSASALYKSTSGRAAGSPEQHSAEALACICVLGPRTHFAQSMLGSRVNCPGDETWAKPRSITYGFSTGAGDERAFPAHSGPVALAAPALCAACSL